MSEHFLTRVEAAHMMRLDPATLGNLAAKRQGPPYMKTARTRGKALYRKTDVLAYLQANGRACGGSSTATSSTSKASGKPARATSTRRRKTASAG